MGLFAALARSDLSVPEAAAKALSLYLLFAIGFKGGAAVADHGIDGLLLASLGAGIVLSFVSPFQGVLCLFLLDMGLVAGRGLRQARSVMTAGVFFSGLACRLWGHCSGWP